ncbi:MAG: triose-phosphate isomerase [Bacteroidales bacterium]|nr:triose-phosphate isomerase [Bacteroidales bacterium]
MRKKIVAGNWKMNMDVEQSKTLTLDVLNKKLSKDVDVILCPPFTSLGLVAEICKLSSIKIAAQNCSNKPQGAFTGEVSASMIKSAGAEYVIIGHSERRAYYGETNEILKEKTDLVLENGLKPIFCCGEVLSEREKNIHFKVVKSQISESLFHLNSEKIISTVIAYEPVWAIGTGLTASPEQAQEMHSFIRSMLTEKYGQEVSEKISILYGGSCKPSNAAELFANKDVDGGLIGGASLVAEDFAGIINSF